MKRFAEFLILLPMRFLLLFSAFCFSVFQNQTLMAQYAIIPKPFLSEIRGGNFIFSDNHLIESYGTDSLFQRELKDWEQKEARSKIAKNKTIQTKISFQWIGEKKWSKYLRKLQLNPLFQPGPEGYVIQIEPNQILLLAQTETGLFYAFQSLKQLFQLSQISCGTIYDKPSFAIRAWQDDISRGPIPKMELLKKEIRTMAHYKLNYFTLYTEHVFKYTSHPDIAPQAGIGAEEIASLKKYAEAYHVELIANQQSFGHMEKVLEKKAYTHLGESKHILSPSREETYALLGDFYREQNACYGGQFFQINADETFGLGSEQNKALLDSLGMEGLYAYHINRVYQILKTYKKKMLMWADIIAAYPEIKNKIPKDIILIPWAYHASTDFSGLIHPISDAGFDFWVAPGINNWLNVYPNVQEAQSNLFHLIRDGYHKGAKGVLNTSWDDDGFTLFEHNWTGFIWGADLSWHAPVTETMDQRWIPFQQALDIQFWGIPFQVLQMEFASLHQSRIPGLMKNKRFFESIYPIYPEDLGSEEELKTKEIQNQLQRLYKKADSLFALSHSQPEAGMYFKMAVRLVQFTLSKNLFRIHYASYINQAQSPELLMAELEELKERLVNLKSDYSSLYQLENRSWWLQENLDQFDRLQQDLQALPNHVMVQADMYISKRGRSYKLTAPLTDAPIYYTLDGSVPTQHSGIYKKPIVSNKNIRIQTMCQSGTGIQSHSNDTFIYHAGIGKITELHPGWSKYHPSYSGGGTLALADGKCGSEDLLRSGKWQGFSGQDLIVVMRFENGKNLHAFEMAYYQCTPQWVILPKQIDLFVSEDGHNYTLFQSISHGIPINSEKKMRYIFKTEWPKQKIVYLKMVARYAGALPPKHPGAGKASMLFTDEMIVK